jgi:hypothetical protein
MLFGIRDAQLHSDFYPQFNPTFQVTTAPKRREHVTHAAAQTSLSYT